jgi:hypothetical protein
LCVFAGSETATPKNTAALADVAGCLPAQVPGRDTVGQAISVTDKAATQIAIWWDGS